MYFTDFTPFCCKTIVPGSDQVDDDQVGFQWNVKLKARLRDHCKKLEVVVLYLDIQRGVLRSWSECEVQT